MLPPRSTPGGAWSPPASSTSTHLDAQVFWDPACSPLTQHGVTAVVGGNCGFSIAPIADDSAHYLMTMLARVEGIPLASFEVGVPWNWRSTAEYLAAVETAGPAVNVGFRVDHSALRRVVVEDLCPP